MKQAIKLAVGGAIVALARLAGARIGVLNHTRIGHLAANTEYYLRRRDAGADRGEETRVFLSSSKPCNRQLQDMIKRRLPVVESSLLAAAVATARLRWPDSPVWIDLSSVGPDDWELWGKTKPQLSFTDDEERRGRELLRSMGIPEGAPFVCFAMRDKAYLDGHLKSQSFRYHDYRDGDVANCLPAAEWLAGRGIYVLRLGAAVGKPFESSDSRIIDYASRFRTDFGDIYLLGRCKFFLGDTAGLFWPPSILGRPTALMNIVPLTHLQPVPNSMLMPKIYKKSGRALGFRQVVASGYEAFLRAEQYEAAGVELEQNTPEDILGMVREMNARVDGDWTPGPDDEELQRRFWDCFPEGHVARGCPARIPSDFLRRHKELLS